MSVFPTFTSHDAEICFNCDKPISGGRESGYHDGAFVATCPDCKMHTFYNLPTPAPEDY